MLEVNSRLKSTPHGGPNFFLLCLVTLFLLKSTTSGRFSVKVNTTWPKERGSETKKRTNKGRESVLFCFQILLSHHNNHLTAFYGLAAASNVEGEREREREREKLMLLDSDQSYTVQHSKLVDLLPLLPALPYRSVTDCAHSVRSTANLGLCRSTAKLSL